MDLLSISRESITDFAKASFFPIQRTILNHNFVKLKRILVHQETKIIYGEIDTGSEDPIKLSFPPPPESVEIQNEEEICDNNDEDDCEMITPDDGDTTEVYSRPTEEHFEPMTEIYSYDKKEEHVNIEQIDEPLMYSSEDEEISHNIVIGQKNKKDDFSKNPEINDSIETNIVIKSEPLDDFLCNPFHKEEKRLREDDDHKEKRIPNKEAIDENIVVKHEPLDLMDDEGVTEPFQYEDGGTEIPIDVKTEKEEVDNFGFASKNHEDGYFDEGEDYDQDDPWIKDEVESFYGEDPGQKSDFSYEPSDEEASVKDVKISKVKGKLPAKKFKTLICPICGKRSKKSYNHSNHMTQCHPDHPYVKKMFNLEKVKLIQSREEMLGLEVPMRRTQCPICNRKGFKGYVSYNDHINGHNNVKSYVCACKSAFTTRHNFANHRKACPKPFDQCVIPAYAVESFSESVSKKCNFDPPYKDRVCPICQKTGFLFKIHYMDHKNTHTLEKPYKCGCSYNTNSLSSFTQHLKKQRCSLEDTEWPEYAQAYRRDNERKLKWFEKNTESVKLEGVGNSTKDKQGINSTQNIRATKLVKLEVVENTTMENKGKLHKVAGGRVAKVRNKRNFPIPERIIVDGQKFYTCWECDFKSFKTTLVYNHYEARHVERTLQCSKCKKLYPSERSLKKHFRQMHEDMVNCDECGDILPKIRLKRHKDFKHLKPFHCDECGDSFGRQGNLLIHKNRHHNVVTCVVCENDYAIKKKTFQIHFTLNDHKVYEVRWMEYNNIERISCDKCEWESGNLEELIKHYKTEHQLGADKFLQYLRSIGTQDPEFIQEMRGKPDIIPTPTKTCFICFKLIPLDQKNLDKCILSHINTSLDHITAFVDWKGLHGIEYFPCPDCDCQSPTLLDAIGHSKKSHCDSPYNYFEYLRAKYAPSSGSGEKSHCFICLKTLANMKDHIATSVHCLYEKKWSKMKNISEFPCSICDVVSSCIGEAGAHSFEAHEQPYEEYMQFIEIHFSRKSKTDPEDEIIFYEDYDDEEEEDPYKGLAVPYDYFVHNSLP
ncbi:hypothetical protein ACFFRR_007775 [Megaselia abdita]